MLMGPARRPPCKFNADWAFLTYLHELGMKTADRWLAEHFDAIGNE
jgi:NTE family protein